MKRVGRALITTAVFILAWWLVTQLFSAPAYMLPGPAAVGSELWSQRGFLWDNALVTLSEILLGLFFGTMIGAVAALGVVASPGLRRWLMPVIVVSQAIPVFALAPLLVLWFGFGMASKVLMAMLIIFFPVTAALADGLRRTEPGWLDLAQTMNAKPWAVMLRLRLPAALPAFASGLRIAVAVAPIGAVLGEWVGASSGLGYVMVEANARIQTALMFAALAVLAAMTIGLWFAADQVLHRVLYWVPEQDSAP